MYLPAALGQAQLPSRSGASCLQDEYPLKFIERIYLSTGYVEKVLNEFNYRETDLRTWHKTWIKHTLLPAIIRSWQTSTPIRTILLTGHTDEVGEASDNYQVGLARAQAVKSYLQEQIRARDPALLTKITMIVLSSGECWPQIPGGKRERRNRRVEILATPEVMTAPPTMPSPAPAQKPASSKSNTIIPCCYKKQELAYLKAVREGWSLSMRSGFRDSGDARTTKPDRSKTLAALLEAGYSWTRAVELYESGPYMAANLEDAMGMPGTISRQIKHVEKWQCSWSDPTGLCVSSVTRFE